ncbi:hypothetical protein [Denitromonas halophila]|nr:hypothetical protein [Denitromonas halophila]
MTIAIHPLALLAIAAGAFFLGVIGRSFYPPVTRDTIRFTTTHGENHEQG